AELRDVSIVSNPAYPAATVEYRSAAPITTKEDEMSESSTSEVRTEEERAEDTDNIEERKLPAGSLRVEDRAGPPPLFTKLTDAFRARGFPAETASLDWGEYRSLSWGG